MVALPSTAIHFEISYATSRCGVSMTEWLTRIPFFYDIALKQTRYSWFYELKSTDSFLPFRGNVPMDAEKHTWSMGM